MITIKEIAKKANVSTGTVDRVLHNRPGVSEKTKIKIQKLLKEHNFKKNSIASVLAMRKKYKIAILMPNHDHRNLFWKSPLLGMQKASEEVLNYGVLSTFFLYNQFNADSFLTQANKIIEEKFDAVILVPIFSKQTSFFVDNLESLSIPYLFLNLDLEGFKNISFIGPDAFKSGLLAGKLMHLCTNTPHNILTVHSNLKDHNHYVITKRIEGFEAFFTNNKLDYKSLNINLESLDNPEEIYQKINVYLENNPSVNGIFVPSSRIGIIAKEINPQRISALKLIGFDTTKQNLEGLNNESISFLISQNSYHQGYEAIHILTKYLSQKIKPDQKKYSKLEIVTKENIEFNERYIVSLNNETEALEG